MATSPNSRLSTTTPGISLRTSQQQAKTTINERIAPFRPEPNKHMVSQSTTVSPYLKSSQHLKHNGQATREQERFPIRVQLTKQTLFQRLHPTLRSMDKPSPVTCTKLTSKRCRRPRPSSPAHASGPGSTPRPCRCTHHSTPYCPTGCAPGSEGGPRGTSQWALRPLTQRKGRLPLH